MKRLWRHIADCKDPQCQVAHCVSSRYVLSHYHNCKDPRRKICGPVRGEEKDTPPAPAPEPAPAPAPEQLADPAPPMEDPDQEAGAKRNGRKHASTIDRANELLANGHKVTLTSAKTNVLREARRLWPASNQRDSDVMIKSVSGKIAVIKEALALGIDGEHIKCVTSNATVHEEAKGLLPHKNCRLLRPRPASPRSRKRAQILAAKPISSKRAKLNADGAETPQERQPLGENRQAVDVGLPRAYYPLGPSPSLVKT